MEPLITFQRRARWHNKHLNVERQVERLYEVSNRWADHSQPAQPWQAGLAALCQIVREAEATSRRVRAVGGSWSLSEAAATNDFLIYTKPLNHIDVGLPPESCAAVFEGQRERLVFAQCGASVLELNQALESAGLALPTSGANNGQTIAGAVSTGTHGAASSVGAMQDCVLGMHLVTSGGEHCWLERASRPVVSDAFVARLGATLRRDDELFNAALVSFGSFGLLHALLLEVVPLYLLEQYVRSFDYSKVVAVLSSLDVGPLELPGGDQFPYHFEAVLNPYALGAGQRGAHVRACYQRALPAPFAPGSPLSVHALGDDLLAVLGAASDKFKSSIASGVGQVIEQLIKPIEGALSTPGQTFGATPNRGPVLSMELCVAVPELGRALECVARVANASPFAGVMSVRFVRASPALLAFTSQVLVTAASRGSVATIEIPAVGSERSQDAFDRIWDALDAAGIAHTFHWGQCLPPDYGAAALERVFHDRPARWVAQRRGLLVSPAARRCFANGFVERMGLAD